MQSKVPSENKSLRLRQPLVLETDAVLNGCFGKVLDYNGMLLCIDNTTKRSFVALLALYPPREGITHEFKLPSINTRQTRKPRPWIPLSDNTDCSSPIATHLKSRSIH